MARYLICTGDSVPKATIIDMSVGNEITLPDRISFGCIIKEKKRTLTFTTTEVATVAFRVYYSYLYTLIVDGTINYNDFLTKSNFLFPAGATTYNVDIVTYTLNTCDTGDIPR